MNPGVSEEAGQTARSFIKSMKSQPLALAMVGMNVIFVAYLWYYTREINENRHQYILETQRLLASCIHVEDLAKVVQGLGR